MPKYHDTGEGSFLGDFAYQRVVERNSSHFLVALNRLFDWEALSSHLIRLYPARGLRGRRPYNPQLMIKLLFLSYLYNVSGRQLEELADQHLLIKWFLGLAVDEAPPDHSTLAFFCKRLRHGDASIQRAFDVLIEQGRGLGVEFGSLQIVDAVHTQADVNTTKDQERQDRGQLPRDPDAKVVNKGKRRVVDPDGQKKIRELRYLGYKAHCSVNARTGVVTSVIPARGNTADNKAFGALRAHDRALNLPITTYGGDRAYDDTDIYERLAAEGLRSAICLRKLRTEKKDPNKQPWLERLADPVYQAEAKQRYRVEQPFGWAKTRHGLGRCRYVGLAGYRIQALITFMVVNAKRLVKLLTGITFRPLAKGRRAERFEPVFAALPWA